MTYLRKKKAAPKRVEATSIRGTYEHYREKESVRDAAYSTARKWGIPIQQICDRLGLTSQYVIDGRK